MSQSNKKYIVFLLFLTVIAIGITVFFIWKDRPLEPTVPEGPNTPEGPSITEPNNEFQGGELVDIYKKYYTNPLDVQIGRPIGSDHVISIVIAGLKNKEIEQTINTTLKNKIENTEYISCEVTGNFSNVLSIMCKGKGENKDSGINIDLTTGNEISFRYLLKDGKYDRQEFTNLIYNSIMDYHGELLIALDKDIDENGEDYTIQLINKIENNNVEYHFSPFGINLLNDGKVLTNISIIYGKLKDYLAIYDRFLKTENIFEVEPNEMFFPARSTNSGMTMSRFYIDYINDLTLVDHSMMLSDVRWNTFYDKVLKNATDSLLEKYYVEKDLFQYIDIFSQILNPNSDISKIRTEIKVFTVPKEQMETFYFDIYKEKNYQYEEIKFDNMYVNKEGNISYQ